MYRGWEKALRKLGHTVMTYNTNDRLTYYGHARLPEPGKPPCEACGERPTRQAHDAKGILQLGMDGLYRELYWFWPDIVFFVSAFYMTPAMLQVIRTRRHKVVMLHTESPYQDEEQMTRGEMADLNLLNDPSNIAAWRELEVPVAYMPHAYDPDIHYPEPERGYDCDFCFVGTLFKSRAEFFSRMDFTGIDAVFGGSGWDFALRDYPDLVKTVVNREKGYRLLDYLGHPADHCVDNAETARFYRRARAGINFYRRESEDEHQGEGWAMGPREVEMAACKLFFLRDPRPEGDDVFDGILPSFSSPEEASDQLHWWVKHDKEREDRASLARLAVADRTFDSNAKKALTLMEEAGIL